LTITIYYVNIKIEGGCYKIRSEIWLPIPSLNNLYEASNFGRIRRSANDKRRKSITPGHILKQQINKRNGYLIVTARPEINKQVNIRVHRIIAEAFYGKCPEGFVVNHKDGNKENNCIENLEYVTPAQNNQHALDNKLRKPADMKEKSPKGENHYNSKITIKEVINICKIRKETNMGSRKMEKLLGISKGTINSIIYGKSWKHITKHLL
jgi:hypothetical protein